MNNPEIQGFTALQREIADRIWQMDTREEIERYVLTMPNNLRTHAWIVMNMIIAAELDHTDYVNPELTLYLRSL